MDLGYFHTELVEDYLAACVAAGVDPWENAGVHVATFDVAYNNWLLGQGGEKGPLDTLASAAITEFPFAAPAIAGLMLEGARAYKRGGELVPYYPPNRGFAGQPVRTTLQPGTVIDRYGGPGGSFASPQGTPPWARSLPSGAENRPLNAYEVVKPLEVDAGPAAPWFNQPGGGIQYDFGRSIQSLVDSGYLRPLK